MIDRIHDAVYELDRIEYDDAIKRVGSWSEKEELLGVEWFSPFSAIPLFWYDLAAAHHVIQKLVDLQKKNIQVTLIGPDKDQFNSLCNEVARRLADDGTAKLPSRFEKLLIEARNLLSANENPIGEKVNSAGPSGSEADTLVNALIARMSDEYAFFTNIATLNQIRVQDSANVTKLRTGYAYAKFSVTQSIRPNDTCSTIVFSNPEPEECPFVLPSIDNPSLLLDSRPIIYITRNQLVIHGLRGAVEALLRCP
jgi:hypothetical protein